MTSNFVDDKESEESIKLQNENAQLNLELCTLHTQCESLELENKSLKEEILSLQEKIKNFEEYIDKIEENDIIENTQINENSISILKEENDPNILKHKIVELQKEIVRLSDNIKEDLINNENMKTEYENQIEILKNDIIALENENDQMRIDVNKIKDKCQIDVKNCYGEISVIRKEKEEAEQKFIEKLKELNQIIKTYQNKILEQEKAYKDLCDSSSKKLKETYDKFTSEIKNLKNNQIDNFSMNEMSLEIHNLKTENIEIKNKLEKSQINLSQAQKELKELSMRNSSFNILEKNLKNKIKELEDKNENLRAEILNSSMNENDVVKD
jgi:chromosome segregation ATPase